MQAAKSKPQGKSHQQRNTSATATRKSSTVEVFLLFLYSFVKFLYCFDAPASGIK